VEKPLKGLQSNIYSFIEHYMREHGRPPTNREIGEAVHVESTGHIDYHLTMLEKKGYIARERKKSRGIKVMREEPRGLRIEGTIAAGAPLDIFTSDQQEMLDLCSHTQEHPNEYVLQVRGQSMIEDHIADGDFVLVERGVYNDGDIVVAIHSTENGDRGAATLKRFYREKDGMRLQPANATMEPIFISKREWDREWDIQGKVTAVYRRC
jgi:repressor LexA